MGWPDYHRFRFSAARGGYDEYRLPGLRGAIAGFGIPFVLGLMMCGDGPSFFNRWPGELGFAIALVIGLYFTALATGYDFPRFAGFAVGGAGVLLATAAVAALAFRIYPAPWVSLITLGYAGVLIWAAYDSLRRLRATEPSNPAPP
ncbi:MAG: hypothetical protein MJE66_05690 [Proteobacteria bacterium]|nr:hypothetical protein [Pseudomonadota bacterium]